MGNLSQVLACRTLDVKLPRLTTERPVKQFRETSGNTLKIKERKKVIMRDMHVISIRHDLWLQFEAPIEKEHTGVPSENVPDSDKMFSYGLFLLITKSGNVSRHGGDSIGKPDGFESSLACLGRLEKGKTVSWKKFIDNTTHVRRESTKHLTQSVFRFAIMSGWHADMIMRSSMEKKHDQAFEPT